MKILFWNIGYGRGIDGSVFSYIKHGARIFRQSKKSQEAIIEHVAKTVREVCPDVCAYAEISTGSKRNEYFNQHKYLCGLIGGEHIVSSAVTKYGNTVFSSLPFHKGNSNGVVSFLPAVIKNHYLEHSRKKLVQEIHLDAITVYVVHLPLVSRDRKRQLREIAELVNKTSGDVVLCGDFNILNGFDELLYIKEKTNLSVAGKGDSTFPAHRPKIQLDVFMYRFADTTIVPNFLIVPCTISDHLPIVLEF